MPEIAAIGLVGAIVTFLAVNLNFYFVHRSFQRPEFKTLNHNLLKVGKYWSLEQGRLIDIETGLRPGDYREKDYQKATRSAFMFGTLLIFLSWLGLLLFVIYFVSINKLAKSRLEQRIFNSELVKSPNLESMTVQNLLREMESLG